MGRRWAWVIAGLGGCADPSGDAEVSSESSSSASSSSETSSSGDGETTSSSGTTDAGADESTTDDGPADPAEVIRVQIDWSSADGYVLGPVKRERSGTPTLVVRAGAIDPLGSFAGVIRDADGTERYRQTIGIGLAYRRVARSLTFRFPTFDEPVTFALLVETPDSDVLELTLETTIDPAGIEEVAPAPALETRSLRTAAQSPSLQLAIYGEGYDDSSAARFFDDAERAVVVLEEAAFPGLPYFDITAVYHPSVQPLTPASDHGQPVPVPDTFLGMFHPYWSGFDRWEDILYPTDEEKFRDALAQVPYDYPFVLADTDTYWGAGNLNAFVAVPAYHDDFAFLIEHEMGHYFGLNEEYSFGGTELVFASGVEPWSQNLSFADDLASLKWRDFVDDDVPFPTPAAEWPMHGIGAYRAGYGGLDPRSLTPAPAGACTMSSGPELCDVCRTAIIDKLERDLVGDG